MKALLPIVLDFLRPGNVIVNAMQNDRRSRFVKATLVAAGSPWIPPATNLGVAIRFKKPDRSGGVYTHMEDNTTSAYVIEGNTIEICLAEQCLTCPGDVSMEINFYTNFEKLTSFPFILRVKPSSIKDIDVVSGSYYNIMTGTLNDMVSTANTARTDYELYLRTLQAYVGAPRVATEVSEMTDQTLIYVYVGSETGYTSGDWYYWNGTIWADGGAYNTSAINLDDTLTVTGAPADAKASGDLIIVSDTQPLAESNKIWFPETDPEVTQVPTWNEHKTLEKETNARDGILEYWGEPESLPINTAYGVQRLGVSRIGQYITLTGRTANAAVTAATAVYIKLNGSLDRATSSNSNNYEADILLKANHTYIISGRLMSGGFTPLTTSANTIAGMRVRDSNNSKILPSDSSNYLVISETEPYIKEELTLSDDTLVKIELYIPGNLEMKSNTIIYCDIQDITVAQEMNSITGYIFDSISLHQEKLEKAFYLSYLYAETISGPIDINDYTNAGNYKVTSSSAADTIDNLPVKWAGRLIVFKPALLAHTMQVYIAIYSNYNSIYIRSKYNGTNAWTDWVNLSQGIAEGSSWS